jgi:hypothetical protein
MLVHDFLWDVLDGDFHVLEVCHGIVHVEIGDVEAHVAGTLVGVGHHTV